VIDGGVLIPTIMTYSTVYLSSYFRAIRIIQPQPPIFLEQGPSDRVLSLSRLTTHTIGPYITFIMSASKSIIVTGASRGIGLAIAKYLLQHSHKVFLVARSAGPLEALKSEYPGQVEFLAADLSDFSVCYFLMS